MLAGVVPFSGLIVSHGSPEVEAVKFSEVSLLLATEIGGCCGGSGPPIS
jgi:hypothetical protein